MKKFKHITSLFILLFLSCNSQNNTIELISSKDFAKKIQSTPEAQIIDVRTPSEFENGHLLNALNINWQGSDFNSQVEQLDKSKPVFVYCQAGGRSTKASFALSKLGFKNIYNLDGGYMQWCMEGFKNNKN